MLSDRSEEFNDVDNISANTKTASDETNDAEKPSAKKPRIETDNKFINLKDIHSVSREIPPINPETADLTQYSCLHILIPRKCRSQMLCSVPESFPINVMINETLPDIIKDIEKNTRYIIININYNISKEDKTEREYTVTLLSIPTEFMEKIKGYGGVSCIFYVGWGEHHSMYHVLNKPPLNKDIAKINRDNEPIAYKSQEITI